jgi:hypothetical protein
MKTTAGAFKSFRKFKNAPSSLKVRVAIGEAQP